MVVLKDRRTYRTVKPPRRLDPFKILDQLLAIPLQSGVLQLPIPTWRFTSTIHMTPEMGHPRLGFSTLLAFLVFLALLALLAGVVIRPQIVETLPVRILEYRHDRPELEKVDKSRSTKSTEHVKPVASTGL